MMTKQEEIKIAVNKIVEIIYEMYIKDLKSGNIGKDNDIKSFGKICKKRNILKNNDNSAFFNYRK